jgi:hypothetical protein
MIRASHVNKPMFKLLVATITLNLHTVHEAQIRLTSRFLGSFVSKNAAISFVMCVIPSVACNNSRTAGQIVMKSYIGQFCSNLSTDFNFG